MHFAQTSSTFFTKYYSIISKSANYEQLLLLQANNFCHRFSLFNLIYIINCLISVCVIAQNVIFDILTIFRHIKTSETVFGLRCKCNI